MGEAGKGLEYYSQDSRKVGIGFNRNFRQDSQLIRNAGCVLRLESTYWKVERSKQKEEGGNGTVSFMDYMRGRWHD